MAGWLAGWLAGSMIIVPILAPSCKLKLARFSAKLRIQNGAECGNTLVGIVANNSWKRVLLINTKGQHMKELNMPVGNAANNFL